MRAERVAAHAAVDEAVAILRDRRARPHERIDKAAKDFLTDVDLASESAMQRSLAASTPDIGFYGEEGGGPPLDSGKVWVADPLDGTVNYATGSPLCGVMLGLLEDGVPTLGVIDLPFLGVRVDSGALADVGSFEDGIIGMGDAFHRGGARLDAYLELTTSVHRRALRFRCVGAASVLWTWLVSGQIQGMVLAHNNPYDVVAGHAIARAAGAICTDYAGAPLILESTGAMAAVPGVHVSSSASRPNSRASPRKTAEHRTQKVLDRAGRLCHPFDDEDEAIAAANDTEYGLAGSIWTESLGRAHRVANELRGGQLWVNCALGADPSMPICGHKQSGWGGERGRKGIEEYFNTKSVYINL